MEDVGGLFVGVVVVAVVVLDVDVVEQVVGEIIISPLGPSFEKKVLSMSDICQVSMYIQGHLASWIERCIGQKKSQEPYHRRRLF